MLPPNHAPWATVFKSYEMDGWAIRIMKRENGKKFIAKVNIEWVECEDYSYLPVGGTSILVNKFEMFESDDKDARYKELQTNSSKHLENLNNIINTFMERCLK